MKMPVNRKEELVYTVLMVMFMAIIMTFYNMVLRHGLSINSLKSSWLVFPLTFTVAFMCEWFIVARFGMVVMRKLLNTNAPPLITALVMPLVIVFGMASLMSLFGTIVSVGFTGRTPTTWLRSFSVNFVFAYPLQILIARPLVTRAFRKVFPVGTIVVQ